MTEQDWTNLDQIRQDLSSFLILLKIMKEWFVNKEKRFQQDSKNCSDEAVWDGQYWTDGQDLTRLKTGLGFDRMDWTAQN